MLTHSGQIKQAGLEDDIVTFVLRYALLLSPMYIEIVSQLIAASTLYICLKMVHWVSTWMSEGSFHMSVSRYHLALIMSYNKQNTSEDIWKKKSYYNISNTFDLRFYEFDNDKIGLERMIQTWNIPIAGGLLSNYGTRVLHNCIRCILVIH